VTARPTRRGRPGVCGEASPRRRWVQGGGRPPAPGVGRPASRRVGAGARRSPRCTTRPPPVLQLRYSTLLQQEAPVALWWVW